MTGANTLANVESWTMEIPGAPLTEIQGLGATAKSLLVTGLPGPATGTVNWRALDNSATAEAAIRAACLAGTSLALDLYESGTKYWDGADAYITSFSHNVSTEGPVSGSFAFTFGTVPTYT